MSIVEYTTEMRAMLTKTLFALFLLSFSARSQETSFLDPLLDRLTGRWVVEGSIGGRQVTHDITAEWVLAHQYLQLHEISREKDSTGKVEYEAIVYFGWDPKRSKIACLWLDVTGGGGLSDPVMGHAERAGNTLPFLFKWGDGSVFHTTFTYEEATDTWTWQMDSEESGAMRHFAHWKLTRPE
jgi:hypothetical protein